MKRLLLSFVGLALMFCSFQAFAQDRTVSGRVTSAEDGSALPGVNVVVKGTTIGTATDSDGRYSLTVPSSGGSLVFSFIGLQTQEITIGDRTVVDVSLALDATQLSEVIVVGYGEQSLRNSVQTVSTVNSAAFKNMPVITPQQLLQGQAAGVQMINSSGVLGAAAAVRIRGASSISGGGSPLYVIDGVPLVDGGNGGFSTAQGAGTGLNPLIDLNPNDIESMTVLKDASAVAIYGSRGANGVILIKTKRGSEGKTNVNFDYQTGWSKPTDVLKYMSPDQYKTFVNDWSVARGLAPTAFPDGGFDWVKAVLRTGRVNTYNLSANGGSDKTKFFVGAGIHDEEGYTIGNDLRRLSGRFNLDHRLSEKVKFNVNYALSYTTSDRIGAENSTFAPLTSSYLQTPSVQPYDADGNFVNTGFIANVLAIEALNTNKFTFLRQTGSLGGDWSIIDNLKFRSEMGIDLVQSSEQYRSVNIVTPGGSGSKFIVQDYKWLTTNTLTYDKQLGEDHYFSALLGQSFETSEYSDITVGGTGFVSDVLKNVGSASTKTTTDATGTQWAIESFFGRFNYRFKDRYLFEASVRRDGSSRFGADKRYGNFWAVSGGWVVSDESFFAGIEFVNFLKLTASYGTSGNDRIGNFPSLQLYGAGTGADYAGSPGLIPTQVPNPLLSWEEVGQFDIGISAAILNSRVSFDVNYFIKNSEQLLFNVPLPFTTGFASAVANVGEMKNSGIDVSIKSTNLKIGDFSWTTSLNMGFLKNEVLKLPENKDAQGRDFIAGTTAQRAIVGETMNTFYLIRYKGVNPETGHAEWLDINGEPTTTPTAADRVVVGSAIPDFTGGLTNTFRYKGFDLTAFFNFSYGNKVLIDGLRFTENLGGTFNKSTDLLDYWKQPGDKAFAPALNSPTAAAGVFSQLSTSQLQDGSYMRLKTLTLGYSAPKSLLDRTKFVQSFRVFLLAQNLWTIQNKDFRGPDPEVSASGQSNQALGESFFAIPQAKSFTIGVNIGL
jgi:TonB-dependent starch-binding outer membrane protein SusC